MFIWRNGKKIWEAPPSVQANSKELADKYVPAILAMLRGAPNEEPVVAEIKKEDANKEADFRLDVEEVFGGEWEDIVTVDDPDLE